ncbi:Imm30 family immunity protein [Acetivibrio clariflavus]|uniref:Imm30 family immunity protein n=1 Tax=Acetivibrio clariflavus TaxID=288965 RepID=UPI0031F4A0F9
MNTGDIKKELERLKQNRLLRDKNEFDNFEEALENLATVTDNWIIKELCEVFDDSTEDEEIMFGLIHLIEDFQGEEGLFETIKAVPNLIPRAKKWAKILNYRILNDDSSRMLYPKILKKLDKSTVKTVVDLLEEIKAEDPKQFNDFIDEVLKNI